MELSLPVEIVAAFTAMGAGIGYVTRAYINDLVETRKFYRDSLLTGFAKNTESVEALTDRIGVLEAELRKPEGGTK